MTNSTPTRTAEIDILKTAYAALNRNDIPAMVSAFDPEFEWTEPPEFPGAGIYRGRAAVQQHITEARNAWAEGACEPYRFIVAGDRIVVFSHVHVRMKGSTDWIEGEVTDVCTFRDGKPIRMRTFSNRNEGLEWAGVDASQVQ